MAGVTGQQGMLTPPRHPIPPSMYSKVRVCPILKFVFPTGLMRLMTSLSMLSISILVKVQEECFPGKDHWIKNLGTAFPYGYNDNINNLGNLTSPLTNNVNVMGLFLNNKRRRRSHGHRSYNKPNIHDVTLMSLLPYVNEPLGPHHIRKSFTLFHLKFCMHCLNKPRLVHTSSFQHQNIDWILWLWMLITTESLNHCR
jgi:hypothetical protein